MKGVVKVCAAVVMTTAGVNIQSDHVVIHIDESSSGGGNGADDTSNIDASVHEEIQHIANTQFGHIHTRSCYMGTFLHWVCGHGRAHLIKALVNEYGFNVNDQHPETPFGPANATPLYTAAAYSQWECIEPLLEAGADPHLANAQGLTPLAKANALAASSHGIKQSRAECFAEILQNEIHAIECGMSFAIVIGFQYKNPTMSIAAPRTYKWMSGTNDSFAGLETRVICIIHGFLVPKYIDTSQSDKKADERCVLTNEFTVDAERPAYPVVAIMSEKGDSNSSLVTAPSKAVNQLNGVDVVLHDLTVRYGQTIALNSADGFFPAGTITAIMGASGTGKTSLLKAIADEVPIHQGRILYDGRELNELADKKMKQRIGIVDQDDVFLEMMGVRSTLIQQARFRNPNRKECEEYVDKILKLLHIDEQAHKTIGTISGGQRKRFCIARELVTRPELLLCDEPTSGLDACLARILIDTLKDITRTDNTTVICSCQQPSEHMFCAFDLVMFLHEGACVYFGPPKGVLAHLNHFGKNIQMAIDDGVPNYFMDVIANGILEEAGGLEPAKIAVKKEVQKAITYYVNHTDAKSRQEKAHAARFQHGGSIFERVSTWFRSFTMISWRLMTIDSVAVFNIKNFLLWNILQWICGTLFWRPDDSPMALKGRSNSIIFMMGILFWNITFLVFPRYYNYSHILIKDLRNGNHCMSVYWAARLVGTLPLDVILPLYGVAIFYLITWPNPDGLTFLYSWLSTAVIIWGFIWLPNLISQVFKQYNAQIFISIWTMFCFFWTDFFAPGDIVVIWLRWLKWVGYLNYAYMIQAFTIWNDKLVIPCSTASFYSTLGIDDQVNNVLCPVDALCTDPPNTLCTDPACNSSNELNGCTATGPQFIEQGRYIDIQGNLWISWTIYVCTFLAGTMIIGYGLFRFNHYGFVHGDNRKRPVQPDRFLEDGKALAGKADLNAKEEGELGTEVSVPLLANTVQEKPDLENFTCIPEKHRATAFDFTCHVIDDDYTPTSPVSIARQSESHFSSKTVVETRQQSGFDTRVTKGVCRKESLTSAVTDEFKSHSMNVVVQDLNVKYGDFHALKDINFYVEYGSLVALMGASGSGKTTTLHAILNKIPECVESGQVTYNGHPWKVCMRQYVGFVEQDDIVIPNLTLRQSLMYTARLRIVDESSHHSRVSQLLTDLQLNSVADQLLGDVSAGERKRFCIARELLGDPRMLILDEPTSSLDSTMSRQLMESLRNLSSNYGMTIISSIHQPSQSIFRAFDNVLLLDKGQQFYYGPPAQVLSSFAKFGVKRPEGEVRSAAEFMLDIFVLDIIGDARQPVNAESTENARKRCTEMQRDNTQGNAEHHDESGDKDFPPRPTPGWKKQCIALTSRMFRLEICEYLSVTAVLLFVGLVCVPGLLAIDIENRLTQNFEIRETIILFTNFTWTVVSFGAGVMRIFQFEKVLRKELSTQTYSLPTYWFARTILSYWYEGIRPLIWVAIVYWIWLPNPFSGSFFAYLVLVPTLVAFFWRCAGIAVSHLLQPSEIALIFTMIIAFNNGWNPYFLQNSDLPASVTWLRYLGAATYQFQMLCHLIFNSHISFECQDPEEDTTTLPLQACDGVPIGESVTGTDLVDAGDTSVGGAPLSFWANFGVLCGMLAAILIGGYISLRIRLRALFRNIKAGVHVDAH